MTTAAMGIHPVAGALGAEVSGLDLARPLDDATVAALRQAWLEHLVLFFRDQDLSPAQFLAFARRFGEPIDTTSSHPASRKRSPAVNSASSASPRGRHFLIFTSAT